KPVAAALAVAAAVALPAGIAAAADSHAGHHANAGRNGDHKAKGFVCRGALASGTYKKLTVPDGASCHGKNATVTVRGGVTVGAGATFVLGSEKGTGGGTIGGGLDAKDAASVQLHLAHVDGRVSIIACN